LWSIGRTGFISDRTEMANELWEQW